MGCTNNFGEAEIRTALAVLLLTLNRSNRKSTPIKKVRVLLRLLTGVKIFLELPSVTDPMGQSIYVYNIINLYKN